MDVRIKKFLSVVIPAHNEASIIEKTLNVIRKILDSCEVDWEIVLVDDGSRDGTFDKLRSLAMTDKRLRGVRLSRNFGKEAAILAGLRSAGGDAVITMDADLQHPPQLIPKMIDEWLKGAAVVDAVKQSREKEGWFVRTRANLFNSVLSKLGGIDLQNSSDFKLLDRFVVNTVTNEMQEYHRFYRGLSDWVGYKHKKVFFTVEKRTEGQGNWNFWALTKYAKTAIVSFTSAPLRIVTIIGFGTLSFGFFVAVEALVSRYRGVAISGYTSIIITLLFIGSAIMISLGIIGEYIANIYDEIKNRPSYLVQEKITPEEIRSAAAVNPGLSAEGD